jgi:hypothetical protein
MTDWDMLARKLGFASEKALLIELYLVRQLPLSKIGELFGYSLAAAQQRLKRHSIAPRARGGANHNRNLSELIRLMDQREVWLSAKAVAFALKTNVSVIYQLRKETLHHGLPHH